MRVLFEDIHLSRDLRVSFEFPLLLKRNRPIWTFAKLFETPGVKHVEGGRLIEHPSDFEMPDFIVGEEVGSATNARERTLSV